MSGQNPDDPNFDPYAYIGFVKNPDGTVTRSSSFQMPGVPPNTSNLSKDIIINQSKNTWVRLFVPVKSFESKLSRKLPVVVYFHGGGLVLYSADSPMCYNFYNAVTSDIPAIIVTVNYRLAPEHRLPAAYDDSIEALHWIKNSDDEWLTKYADISNCFLMGTSAGGNIAYHVGFREALSHADLKPLEIKGFILHHPYFGGNKRTASELRLKYDKLIPLSVCDVMWELSLPIGSDRDHHFCNPMVDMIKRRDVFDRFKILGWKILVTGCSGDPLIDRQIELAIKLEELGVSVTSRFDEGGYHSYDLADPPALEKLINRVKEFIEGAHKLY